MSNEHPKRLAFEHLATVAKAMAHPRRIELLELVAQRERSVEELAALAELGFNNASQHLKQLRQAGLLTARKTGKRVLYRLADDGAVRLLASLNEVAELRIAEMERVIRTYFRSRDELDPISRRELLRRMRDGLVTVIDARPREEFAAGHIQGAINVPLGELRRRLRKLPRDQEIVAYCRGPYCVLSYEAVAELRKRGFKALRLEDGYPEWKAAGLPVECPSASA
jgi:ArsR family transcriptional regulator